MATSTPDHPPYTGGCLCGQVRFEITSEFDNFHLCHCHQCQHTTGTTNAANLMTEPGALRWLKGGELVSRYDVPDRTISNAFCQGCGAALPFISVTGKRAVVPAGSLDQTPPIPPIRHIFWNERAAWYDSMDKLPKAHNFGDDQAENRD